MFTVSSIYLNAVYPIKHGLGFIVHVLVFRDQITVQCLYDAVNFQSNHHKRHSIARPWRRGIWCLLWVQPLIKFFQSLQCRAQYTVLSDRIITALDCIICSWICVANFIIKYISKIDCLHTTGNTTAVKQFAKPQGIYDMHFHMIT